MKYAKPHLSFEDQLLRITQRGMQIDDCAAALDALRTIGYYRLSAYWHHWRLADDDAGTLLDAYHPAARFEDSLVLYNFDRRLRLALLDAIERIEIALRVAVAYVAGQRHPFIHKHPELLGSLAHKIDQNESKSRYELCTFHCERLWQRSSEDFAVHVRKKYEGDPAIWVLIETWDFGLLSNFYKLLLPEDQQDIAAFFLVGKYSMFESWIASLNYVRNLCAHHSRIFRKSLVVRPGIKHMREISELDHVRYINVQRVGKIYSVLAVIAYIMQSVEPESAWFTRTVSLFESLENLPTASLADYGFPDDWRSQAIWM